MSTFKHISASLLAVAIAGVCGSSLAQTVTLKVHHFLGPQSIQHTTMLGDWCKAIAKDSANRLQCQIYPAMQLGGTPAQLYDQARDGVADVVWTLPGYTANRFPMMEVFELPFMMTNADATSRAAWDFYEKYAKDEFKDVKVLAMHVHGPGNIFTTNKPITKLEDFKGMKLRAPTRQTNKLLASMGATPVGMPVPAVPDALSKGTIDGAVIPYEVAPGIKVDEIARYVSETDHSQRALYTALFVVPMNKARYESLPADLKAVIDKNSGREFSALLGRTQEGNDVPGKQKVIAAGQKVTVIPPAELVRWQRASDPIDDAWVADMDKRGHNGKQLLQAARDLITANTKK